MSTNLLVHDAAVDAAQPWLYRHPIAFYPWWIVRTARALAQGRR